MKKRLKHSLLPIFLFLCIGMMGSVFAQNQPEPVELKWLSGSAPEVPGGVSWGVPWGEGEVQPDETFRLQGGKGQNIPVQSWTMAYWPDGSVKWTGFAATSTPEMLSLNLTFGESEPVSGQAVQVYDNASNYIIDTGPMQVIITKWGETIIKSLYINGREIASEGQLLAVHQEGPDGEAWETSEKTKYHSRVKQVTVEQDGPVRAVVKLEGDHKKIGGNKEWLPFTVRLYFHAGQTPFRMIHSVIYDGDQEQDFIKGIGVKFDVPFREEIHNRHVRFTGKDSGLWAEPLKLMRLSGENYRDIYRTQETGQRIPDLKEYEKQHQNLIHQFPEWADFKLVQNSADGFNIYKRTNPYSTWIESKAGTRSSGLAFVGDVSGGLSVGLKDFWQSYPSSLEIRNATAGNAELRVWLWSPEVPAKDMRHYDTKNHGLPAVYEDVQLGLSKAHGVARTSELTFFPTDHVPSHDEIINQSTVSKSPPVLSPTPEYIHSANVFGVWSLPDRSTIGKSWIEAQLDSAITHYQREIEQRRWYGFWNYGDVMHSYDNIRNVWRYDLGGYAWANTELVPDMWLWYSYLRTGREDIFRMAEAMTRHTSEVDVYHLGDFKGLGTRHNVIHWGDGAKEARISQAALKRFYYYLTTDERVGELMKDVRNIEETYYSIDPIRLAFPADQYTTNAPARIRFGPDWLALAGNWITEWERTQNTDYKDKITTGMESIASMQYGLFSGPGGPGPGPKGFDPETGRLINDIGESGDHHTAHLVMIMGGAEVAFELLNLIENPQFKRAFIQYSRLYSMPSDASDRNSEDLDMGDGRHTHWHARLTAYAARETGSTILAERAWNDLLNVVNSDRKAMFSTVPLKAPNALRDMRVAPWVSTNNTAQWSLNAIQVLELIGDQMPENHFLWDDW